MKERGYGHIINVTSRAAQFFSDGGSTYFASKHAAKAISECARLDLVDTPVRVTEIRPGLVETEFFEVADKGDRSRAERIVSRFKVLEALDVADNCVYAATRPLHV